MICVAKEIITGCFGSSKTRRTEQLVMLGNLGRFRKEGAFELGFKAQIEVYCL